MESIISDYLKLPLFSNKMKEVIMTLIDKKNSIISILANHVLTNIENDFLSYHEKYMEIESIRMLDLRKDNESYVISYLPVGKVPEYSNNSKWTRKNRQQGKIGKVILAFLNPYLPLIGVVVTEQMIEEFVNDVKNILSNKFIKIQLVRGEDISHYYNEEFNVYKEGTTLGNSCMRHESCQAYFQLYECNPDCEMVVIFDTSVSEEKIVGRAIVWTFEGKKYVDRYYVTLDMYGIALRNYVKGQKWCYKKYNAYDDEVSMKFMCPNDEGEYVEKNISMHFDYKDYLEYFPYMDTVKYMRGNTITNDPNYFANSYEYTLNDTEGDRSENCCDEMVVCEICGDRIRLDDSVYIDDVGYVCDCHTCYAHDLEETILIEDAFKVYYDSSSLYIFVSSKVANDVITYKGRTYISDRIYEGSCLVSTEGMDDIDIQGLISDGYEQISDLDFVIKL